MIGNNGRIETFEQCMRKGYWSYLHLGTGLQSKFINDNLIYGSVMHIALASLYAGREDVDQNFIERALNEELAQTDNGFDLEWEDKIRQMSYLIRRYQEEVLPKEDFVVNGIERTFYVPLRPTCSTCLKDLNPDRAQFTPSLVDRCEHCNAEIFVLAGRVDLSIFSEGRPQIMDHKTTKAVSATYLKSWDHSSQLIGYALGYSRIMGEEFGVTGYIANIIRKSNPIPETKQCTECHDGKRKKLTCTACNFSGRMERESQSPFARVVRSIGPNDYKRYIQNTERTVSNIQMYQSWSGEQQKEAFPMNRTACYARGPCPFLDLCHYGDPDNWREPSQYVLGAHFDARPKDYVTLVKEEAEN